MSLTTAIAIYFIIWWIALFAVLPWGVRSQEESGAVEPGTDPGAPALAHLRTKLLWTTIVSGVIFGVCFVVYSYQWVTFDSLAALFGS